MRTLTILLCLAVGAARAEAQEADSPAAVVDALFRAMKTGNADAMAALLHPEVRLVTTSSGDDGPVARVVPADRWLDGVRASTRELDERIHDVRVQEADGLASVWADYDLFVDGVHSHCGVDAFHLVRVEDGSWRIIEIADTRSMEGCRGG